MTSKTTVQIPLVANDIALVCHMLNQEVYESPCVQEVVSLIYDEDFNREYNYAIYTDEMPFKENIFMPRFHTYYLQSKTKDVILLDEQSLPVVEVYSHHRFYIYNNKNLLEKYNEQYENKDNIKHIKSIKDINNVQESE